VEPQSTPQTISFQPGENRRVISPLTAAQMREMLQGVVLHGTGRKAILEGYSSAGKTGTAQKVDPATGVYSKTKYVASFAGFAPVNDAKVAVAVILDSAVGLHQGGQVSAPVFQRVAQQVLEYMHVPHDVELPPSRQVLMARRNASDKDLDESSPDHLGASLDLADAGVAPPTPAQPKSARISEQVVPASLTTRETVAPAVTADNSPSVKPDDTPDQKLPASGTVVLEAEEGGISVPSFLGKNVRAAVEAAQDAGLDLDAVGSGVAREQSPAPGAKVATGSRVMVKFGR
jgi:cell division protein FtsI (penicillin-binding protein 3)